jgi:choice-of-anchor C domain-containing protein
LVSGLARASGDLIKNGSFGTPVCGAGVCEYGIGSTAIPHWRVGGNSVDLVSSAYFQPAVGNQSIDLSGSTPDSVTQQVATAAGTAYVLSWHLAGNPACGQSVKTMQVSWNGTVVDTLTFNTTGHSTASMGWKYRKITLTVSGSTSTVSFADATPDGSPCGATLDNVVLKAA